MMKTLKKYYLAVIVMVISIIGLVVMMDNENETVVFSPVSSNEQIEEIKYIYVDIKGEVMNPGVYKVEEFTRLFQIIALAGGVTGDADVLAFNFSTRLRDEQVVYIPSIGEDFPMITEVIENIDDGIVNINTATITQLDTLPGIGPATAQSIIDYRDENGDFETVEDLIEVAGIGEATMNEIRELITT